MKKTYAQSQHLEINRRNYPGTRQLCSICGCETERCEEDALYIDGEDDPICEECYDIRMEEKGEKQ